MSLFGNILKALGIGKADAGVTAKPAEHLKSDQIASVKAKPMSEMSEVDVAAKMDALAAANPQKLEWKVSIVDMLKLLDIDSSYENRKELAKELGATAETMEDSARMNIWLHKAVLRKISENGGRVPASLMD